MKKPIWTDEMLVQAIKGDPKKRINTLQYLAMNKLWQQNTLNLVLQLNGDRETAQDVFQESLLILDVKIRNGNFNPSMGSLSNFFLGIVKYKYIGHKRRKDNQTINIDVADEMPSDLHDPGIRLEEQENAALINKAINSLGSKCREVLQLQKLEYSMKDIARLLELSSADMAKKRAYECRKALRGYFLSQPHLLKEMGINLSGSKFDPTT